MKINLDFNLKFKKLFFKRRNLKKHFKIEKVKENFNYTLI